MEFMINIPDTYEVSIFDAKLFIATKLHERWKIPFTQAVNAVEIPSRLILEFKQENPKPVTANTTNKVAAARSLFGILPSSVDLDTARKDRLGYVESVT